jgi:hypothetical protein
MIFQGTAIALALFALTVHSIDPLVAETAEGAVLGHYTPAGIREWKGKLE